MKKKIVRGFSVYLVGALLQKGINFLLIPLYIRLLSTEEMGLLDLSNTTIVLLCIIFSMGLPNIWQSEFYNLKGEERANQFQQIVSAYVVLVSPLALILLGLLQLYNVPYFGTGASNIAPIIILSTSYFTFFQTLFKNTMELAHRPFTFVFNSLIVGLLGAALNIFLVIVLKGGYVGALGGNLLGLLLSLFYAIYIFRREKLHFNFLINPRSWLSHVKIGLPFVAMPLAYWVITSSDRWFIVNLNQQSLLGIYGVATKFSALFDPLLIAPILSIYTPLIYKRFADGQHKQYLGLSAIIVLVFFFASALVVRLGAKFVLTDEYTEALVLIPIQIMGYAFYLVTLMSNAYLIFLKKSKESFVIILVVASLNLLANAYFIPRYSILGAAWVFLISNGVWTGLSLWLNLAFKLKKNV